MILSSNHLSLFKVFKCLFSIKKNEKNTCVGFQPLRIHYVIVSGTIQDKTNFPNSVYHHWLHLSLYFYYRFLPHHNWIQDPFSEKLDPQKRLTRKILTRTIPANVLPIELRIAANAPVGTPCCYREAKRFGSPKRSWRFPSHDTRWLKR